MTQYHEPVEELSAQDRDIVRALMSLKEEVEAVNWYHQRAAASTDPELKAILLHNRDEEIEHAAMALEWLRRLMPEWENELKTYLWSKGSVAGAEEAATGGGEDAEAGGGEGEESEEEVARPASGDLGIGKPR